MLCLQNSIRYIIKIALVAARQLAGYVFVLYTYHLPCLLTVE